jgi:DNA replication and repair protein RecF
MDGGGSRATLASLSLRDFRNFERLQLMVPEPGFVLVGENGHGKTNLLEAVAYLSLMRSVRGARDADLARFGADGFHVEAHVRVPAAHVISVGFERASRRKRVRIDGGVVERLSDALGALPTVLFSPGDAALVAGAPSARRRFLDVMLALTSRPYLTALQHYRAALERRNAALRDAGRHPTRVAAAEVWDPPLAEHGAVLMRARVEWVRRAQARFAERCQRIGETSGVALRYAASVDPPSSAVSVEEALLAALASRRGTDLRLGVTGVGPHRDDLVLLLDGRELRTFGSAGQQRTAAIALRTLEAETVRDARDAAPVFLLDDPFAELDATRSARVLGLLQEIGLGQTVLAVPRETDIPAALSPLPRYRITQGCIQPLDDR